jgi:hypothetical protein
MGTSTYLVDYALKLKGEPIILVEAKAFNSILSNNHANQIISYGKVKDVRWVVLTNGRTLKLFDTKAGKNEEPIRTPIFWINMKHINKLEFHLLHWCD